MEKPITVCLEDRGQDFLEFDIQDGLIVATRPLQGWVWDGKEVLNSVISVGDFLQLRGDFGTRTLFYRVTSIRPLIGLVQVGPTDI